jgi:hypothetical protein
MERVCDTHTSICMERHQMSPEPRPRHLMIGRWSSSACMSLISALLELHVPYPRLFSAKRLPSIGDTFTCFGLHRPGCIPSASHHACKPSDYTLLSSVSLGRCRNTASYAEYVPDAIYITTCREEWCSCLPTSRLCLSVRHARATSAFYPYTPGTRLACAGAR